MTIPRTHIAIVASFVLATAAFVLTGRSDPAEARPMLNPCQYDHQCITTTVRRTFNPIAELSANGHKVTVEVHAPCEDDDRYAIQVKVSQGAVTAEGWQQGFCDASDEYPVVHATTKGDGRGHLEPGDATACGHALTWNQNHHESSSDTSWCRTITLVED